MKFVHRTPGSMAVLALLLATCAAPTRGQHRAQVSLPADDLVGWYRGTSDDAILLTYRAAGGLWLVDLPNLRIDALTVRPDGMVSWPYSSEETRDLAVQYDEDGAVRALEWADEHGETHRLVAAPPGHYVQRQVEYRASDGTTLTATVMVPPGPGPHPGAAIIHGSGESSRDNH